MKDGKWFKYLMIILFLIFITLYISQATGYYDYLKYKKVELTSEKMKQFEEDVKNGKNVDISNYMESTVPNYSNSLSNFNLGLSKFVRGGFKRLIESTFGVIGKMVSDS